MTWKPKLMTIFTKTIVTLLYLWMRWQIIYKYLKRSLSRVIANQTKIHYNNFSFIELISSTLENVIDTIWPALRSQIDIPFAIRPVYNRFYASSANFDLFLLSPFHKSKKFMFNEYNLPLIDVHNSNKRTRF